MSVDTYSSASTSTCWTAWTSSTSSTSTSNSTAWVAWSSCYVGTPNRADNYAAPTPEQVEERRLAAERETKKRAEADARAEELLLANLTPDQRRSLDEMKSFVLKSEMGKTYRIRRVRSMNVDEMGQRGEVLGRFCIVPALNVPLADQILAQKLILEHNEAEFLRIANRGH